jgi:beta-phosphoglucomutase-like phosphatase (HAD superfamily)
VEVAEQGLRFFPHAAETLATLAARWPLAINSGALRPEIEYALRRLNCREYVAAIVSAEDAVNCKPHPEGYRLALQALRDHMKRTGDGDVEPLDACQCLVIEDSLAGVISAKDAGMFVVGVTNTYASDQLRQAGAVDVIDSLAALTPDWISQRFEPVGGPV